MKKLILALLFGVGMFIGSGKLSASNPDYDGIAYVTSASSNVFISTQCPIELIDLTMTSGFDINTIVIVDSAPWIGLTGANVAGVSTSTLVGWNKNAVAYPTSQWATCPMIINSATNTANGVNQVNLRGTIIRNGLNVFKDIDVPRREYWTLRYRKLQ